MSEWRDEINARDAVGNPTPLAAALEMLQAEGCDCCDNGPCLGCVCERALRELWRHRDEARTVAAVLAHAYDHDTRPPDYALAAARSWRRVTK